MQFAKRVAGIMVGDRVRKAGIEFIEIAEPEQEISEFEDLGRQGIDAGKRDGVAGEEFGEVMRDHRRATARRHDDGLGSVENIEKMAGHRTRVGEKTAIKRRLRATGLAFAEFDLEPETFQYFDHGHSGIGEKLIYEASDKNRDASRHASRL